MTDIRAGLKDLQFFARKMQGIIEMVPYLENASRLESEVEQNVARNQKLQLEITELKEVLSAAQKDVAEAGVEATELREDAKAVYRTSEDAAFAESTKIIAAGNSKVRDIQKAAEGKLKETDHHIKEQEKKLAQLNKAVADEKKDLKSVQSRIARIKADL